MTIFSNGILNSYAWIVIPLLFAVNAGYGGGFSNVPTLLSDHFGMKKISQIHGLVLSAWAFAGLTGNQMANFIVQKTGKEIEVDGNMVNPSGYQNVLYATLVLYVIALIICFVMVKKRKEKITEDAW